MPKHAAIRAAKPLHTAHDRNQVINRAPSPRWVANFREQIKVKELIGRLQRFALDDPDNPTGARLTRTQAQVALSLLRKVLPDMQSLEVSGNQDQPITVHILRFADPEASNGSLQNGGAQPHRVSPSEPLTIDLQPDAFEAQIEANPRLIEDEPPERSQRMTRKRKPNQ
jgi:hypothetical protein